MMNPSLDSICCKLPDESFISESEILYEYNSAIPLSPWPASVHFQNTSVVVAAPTHINKCFAVLLEDYNLEKQCLWTLQLC